ncbi:transposable element Tcb2 transposase [Trichonephila clavipes]|nr:transposable element Tcb2 transposase [Trichonephila clavipes]
MDPTCQQGTVQAGGGSVMEYSSEFRHFRWPPKFPDMNVIGHICDAFQRAIQKRSTYPLTPTDLWTTLQDSWCQLPPELLQTSIEFMPWPDTEHHMGERNILCDPLRNGEKVTSEKCANMRNFMV